MLLRQSWRLRHTDPKEMCRVADLAREAGTETEVKDTIRVVAH